jgi:hypothetical protein
MRIAAETASLLPARNIDSSPHCREAKRRPPVDDLLLLISGPACRSLTAVATAGLDACRPFFPQPVAQDVQVALQRVVPQRFRIG